MARTVRDARLETRTARQKLVSRHEPHWRAIDAGMHLGYRKGTRKASWLARFRRPDGHYAKSVLGIADDVQDADGTAILDYSTAQAKARAWFAEQFLAGDIAVRDAFIRVLSAGGSDYPHEILLNEAGLDMTQPEAYEPVLRRMNGLMDRIEALL